MATLTRTDESSGDSFDIWYDEIGGTGSPVLMVHGITENSTSWGSAPNRLADSHRVVVMDLRGHGRSGSAGSYALADMAADVMAVAAETGMDRPHLIGHSLGGAIVSFAAGTGPVASVTNVDQSLQLGAFKEGLTPAEPLLRDPESFPAVMDSVFGQLYGERLSTAEQERLGRLRRLDQDVVLGVWDVIFSNSEDEIATIVETALSAITDGTPYLSLFGIDPGPDYGDWLGGVVAGAQTEVWDDHGHYPHLVDPARFLARVGDFLAG